MLVMPLGVFKAQGRIMKSTKAWRDKALADGSLVVHVTSRVSHDFTNAFLSVKRLVL